MGQSLEAALTAVSMLPAQEDVFWGSGEAGMARDGQASCWGAAGWAGLEAAGTQQGAPAQ